MGVCSTKSKKKSSKEIRNDTQAIGSNTNNNRTEIPQDRRNEDRENQRARLSNLLIPVPRTGYTGNISPRYEVDNDNYLNVNISINDEFSNRLPIVTNRYIAGRINHVVGTPNLTGAENIIICTRCHQEFTSHREHDNHLRHCHTNDRTMHNSLNEILHLMHSLNQHLQSENRFQWTEEVEEATEYIDWRRVYLDDGSCIWTKDKKVLLSPEELKQIEKIPKEKLVNERYYVKRIWLNRYINNHLYDKTTSNTTLVVSRENIFEESYNQFMTTDGLDLKRAMHIFFIDEVAHDVGGVYREWYACLFESIFSTEFNFFTLVTESNLVRGTYYISETEPKVYKDLSHYEFIGKILAKAIFDKITIKANFNKILIKHLLKLPVELEDLKFYDTGLYFSLKSLLEDSLKENGEFTFTWNIRVNGELKEIELIPNGASIYLNDDNKSLFIKEVIYFVCLHGIKDKLDALSRGFYSLMNSDIIKIFEVDEFLFLLSGQNDIDVNDWKNNTIYKGYYNDYHPTIKMFWEILDEMPKEQTLMFYKFCTGNTHVPIDGFGSLQGTRNKFQKFCIESPSLKQKLDDNRLIEAKTCFNRISLPEYSSKDRMRKSIEVVLNNNTNYFGLQ